MLRILLTFSLIIPWCHAVAAPPRPNLLVILADDLGYGDVQCYNPERGKLPTPHIDRLAAQGMRFTDAHSSSGVCSPSRYTLLTGRYHWRTRLQQGIVGAWGQPLIAPDRLTIAGLVKQQGYRTAAVGKWHLGWDWPIPAGQKKFFNPPKKSLPTSVTDAHRAAWKETFLQPVDGGPVTRGFDTYFGTDVPNWAPYCFIENDRTVGVPSTLLPAKLLANNMASRQGPALPDWSLEAILPALGDRACALIAEAADHPEPFLLYMPLTSPHTPLAVNEEWKGKSGMNNAAADLIMETDAVVGRVLEALEKSGQADRTLVVFTSDNGFAPYVGAKELVERGHFPSGPLRGYKGDAWEGGHRVAFIARWPGVVESGTVCHQLIHQADLMATFADILSVHLPDHAGEDSFSLYPLLRGKDQPVREQAISQGARGLMALREGSWKYLPGSGGGGGWSSYSATPKITARAQLYNLDDDLGERVNVYTQEPDRAAHMQHLLEQIVTRGRSTPGTNQANDVKVNPRRFLKAPPKQTTP